MDNRLIKYLMVLLLVVCLVGCSEEESSQKTAKSKQAVKKETKSAVVAVAEPEKSEPVYVYNPLGKRDPFENPLRAIVELSPESGVPLTPLQKFDLGQLRLIGVIIGKGEPRAMVIAPEGKSFILKKGTKIGKNNGVVSDITTEAVLVKEQYYDFSGEIKSSVQEIKLPKQGGVK